MHKPEKVHRALSYDLLLSASQSLCLARCRASSVVPKSSSAFLINSLDWVGLTGPRALSLEWVMQVGSAGKRRGGGVRKVRLLRSTVVICVGLEGSKTLWFERLTCDVSTR